MAGRAIAVAAALLSVHALAARASADDGVWRGTLATDREASCEFSELPAEATVSGGKVAIRVTFKGLFC